MAVHIEKILCGKTNTREEEAADKLILMLSNYFDSTNVKGDIYVLVNTMIYRYLKNEIDILVLGSLDGFELEMSSSYKTRRCREPFPPADIKVKIEDFCFILEHKQQTFEVANSLTGQHGVEITETKGVVVYYPSTGTVANATSQAKEQADGLNNKLNRELGHSPFIVPIIWLENVPQKRVTRKTLCLID